MSRTEVAIVDGGGANIASLGFALERIGVRGILTSDADAIRRASHVILPGVGAARSAMTRLEQHDLPNVLRELEQPVLGICLGMQLLAAMSDEDDTRCLGILPDRAFRLAPGPGAPVPNMGWCRITKSRDDALLEGIDDGSWFYFVHSYALPVSARTVATAVHTAPFSAVIASGNFRATQFHPERSAAAGARLLRNFVAMRS